MSIFKKKNSSFSGEKTSAAGDGVAGEKVLNARLEAENSALKARLKKLAEINGELNAKIAKLEASLERLEKLKTETAATQLKTAEDIEAENVILRAKDIISDAERESEDIKNAALMRYKAEIKRIKALVFAADAELMANGAETAKDKRKQALVAALKEMLNFDETALTVEQAGEKAEALTEFLRGGRRPEDDSYFDLDEVLNPKEELDLEALCRELGVME